MAIVLRSHYMSNIRNGLYDRHISSTAAVWLQLFGVPRIICDSEILLGPYHALAGLKGPYSPLISQVSCELHNDPRRECHLHVRTLHQNFLMALPIPAPLAPRFLQRAVYVRLRILEE